MAHGILVVTVHDLDIHIMLVLWVGAGIKDSGHAGQAHYKWAKPQPSPFIFWKKVLSKRSGWLLFDLSALKVWHTAVSFSILEVCSPLICAKPYASFILCPHPSLSLLFDDAQTAFKSFLKTA